MKLFLTQNDGKDIEIDGTSNTGAAIIFITISSIMYTAINLLPLLPIIAITVFFLVMRDKNKPIINTIPGAKQYEIETNEVESPRTILIGSRHSQRSLEQKP